MLLVRLEDTALLVGQRKQVMNRSRVRLLRKMDHVTHVVRLQEVPMLCEVSANGALSLR